MNVLTPIGCGTHGRKLHLRAILEDCVAEEIPATAQGTYWSHRFSEAISIPGGGILKTLRDAGAYISRLPEPVYRTEHWRVATYLLIETAEGTRAIEFARFSIVSAHQAEEREL